MVKVDSKYALSGVIIEKIITDAVLIAKTPLRNHVINTARRYQPLASFGVSPKGTMRSISSVLLLVSLTVAVGFRPRNLASKTSKS